MVYLLPFWSYLAGSKSVSACPSDPDTMTNTALEAAASSSDKFVDQVLVQRLSVLRHFRQRRLDIYQFLAYLCVGSLSENGANGVASFLEFIVVAE